MCEESIFLNLELLEVVQSNKFTYVMTGHVVYVNRL